MALAARFRALRCPRRLRRTHLHQWERPHAPHCQENWKPRTPRRLMLVAFTGTVKAPPSPLTSTDRFTKVVRESSTMSRMVEDLLFLARTESAATPFRTEPVEAQVLLAGLECRAGALAAEHDATLDTTLLATGLHQGEPCTAGTGDPGPRGQRGKVRPGGTARNPRVRLLRRGVARRHRCSRSRHTGNRTPTHLRAFLQAGRCRGARQRPRPLDSADHSRSPRRSH